jgi:hypothetical protein
MPKKRHKTKKQKTNPYPLEDNQLNICKVFNLNVQ